MRHIATVVSPEDLLSYFKGKEWDTSITEDGGIDVKYRGDNEKYDLNLEQKSVQFNVEIHAYEDEMDSDEAITDNPSKFIIDFLKSGTPSGHLTSISSFTPDLVSKLLHAFAVKVEREEIGPRRLAAIIRRIPILISLKSHVAARGDLEKREISKIVDDMKDRGWRVEENKDKHGMPEITIDVAGIYEAKVTVDSIAWGYSFKVPGKPEVDAEGITDDPIDEFEKYIGNEEVEQVFEDYDMIAKADTELPGSDKTHRPPSSGPTTPPPPPPPPPQRGGWKSFK